MGKVTRLLFVVVGLLLASRVYAADVYAIDAGHSTLGFSIKHMMVSSSTGAFDQIEGSIAFDPNDLAASKAEATIQAKSINTRQEKRDGHLRSADFFDVEKFPTITFVSKAITQAGEGYTIVGDLTMKGVTKEVSIPVTVSGPVKTAMGTVLGLSGSFTLNRQDYGITWNKALDQAGVAVANEVKVNIDIEAKKQESVAVGG